MSYYCKTTTEKYVTAWYWLSIAVELCFVMLVLISVCAITNPNSEDPQIFKAMGEYWHLSLIGLALSVISGIWACKYMCRYDL